MYSSLIRSIAMACVAGLVAVACVAQPPTAPVSLDPNAPAIHGTPWLWADSSIDGCRGHPGSHEVHHHIRPATARSRHRSTATRCRVRSRRRRRTGSRSPRDRRHWRPVQNHPWPTSSWPDYPGRPSTRSQPTGSCSRAPMARWSSPRPRPRDGRRDVGVPGALTLSRPRRPRPGDPRSPRPCGPRTPPAPRPSRVGGMPNESSVRASSAATSSNSSGAIRSSRCASSRPSTVLPGLRGRELERAAGDVAHPQRAHELEPRQPVEAVRVPFAQRRVLRALADDRVLDQRVAEAVDHRGDRECTPKPVIETGFRHVLHLASDEPSIRTRIRPGTRDRRRSHYN